MNNWRLAGWRGFLSDRVRLYELCEYCAVWGGTPTERTGLHRIFSEVVCYEIDVGLAQYRLWYRSRMEARQKVGKHRWEATYKTLDDVLGVTEEMRRGGWQGDDLKDVSLDYKDAVIAAAKAGQPIPDITKWLAAQQQSDEFA